MAAHHFLAAVGCVLMVARASADDRGPVTNHLGPVQVQWNVIGEFGNGMGVRGTANVYLPTLPVFGGVTARWSYGVDASHAAGDRSSALTRFFLGHDTIEVRGGLDLADWTRLVLGSHYDYDFQPNSDGSTSYLSARYESAVPAYRRRGLYAGLRYRRPHSGDRCPDDGTLPEDCVDASALTLIGGVSLFYAADVEIDTREHGALRLRRHRLIEFRALYTPADGYARTSLARQFGGEILVTYGGTSKIAVMIGAGWDGDMASLTLGIGAGAPVSLAGAVPAAGTILR